MAFPPERYEEFIGAKKHLVELLHEVLKQAETEGIAVGHFNVSDLGLPQSC